MDAKEDRYRGEAVFDAAAGHCNEWVGHVWGENAGEEANIFLFVFKDMVANRNCNGLPESSSILKTTTNYQQAKNGFEDDGGNGVVDGGIRR